MSIEELYNEYEEYCKKDKHPLPYIIWIKHKKKVNTIEQVRCGHYKCHNYEACKKNSWSGCIYEPQTDCGAKMKG